MTVYVISFVLETSSFSNNIMDWDKEQINSETSVIIFIHGRTH